MLSKVWHEITYPFLNFNGHEITDPFLNFNGFTVEVYEWISNFIQHIHAGIKVKAC